MLAKEIMEIYELIDRPGKVAESVKELYAKHGAEMTVQEITEDTGSTDFVRVVIPGKNGKTNGGSAPTLGVIGRLGGVGARPERLGMVSDGDGALSALSIGLRLARIHEMGDILEGDVVVTTHLCTNAPTAPHDPVPFMGSPVDLATMNDYEVDDTMDAVVSIDTSRGNKIINNNYFAITPTVKEGWILKVADDMVTLMEYSTGTTAAVTPITMQDITPYGNGVYHFNSLMQPACATKSPVMGLAITSNLPVPGCGTGVTNLNTIDGVGRYVLEVAKAYTAGKASFYDEEEYNKLVELYGSMDKLQSL